MGRDNKKSFHTGGIKKTITVNSPKDRVWKEIGNIAGLAKWVTGVKETVYLSKRKKGIGAVRKITFEDGNAIEEHVVAWEPGEYFTYVATDGLPLRAYVATISIKQKTKKSTQVTWQSYLNSEMMSKEQFTEFVGGMASFYEISLKNLEKSLEKGH